MTDREELVKPRKHYFVPSDDDFDTCARCGKNIRNDEHCSNTERPETDAEYIARLESALRRLAEAGTQEAALCCDVRLPPITTIRAGCKISTPVAWADKYSETHPITAESKKVLSNNPTTEPYWSRFSIPLYTAQPADAGMREALGKICIYRVEGDASVHLLVDGEKIGAFGQHTSRAMALLRLEACLRDACIDAALTAPGATTKSDVEALAATTAERPGTVTSEPEPSTSDPSSTRSEVAVEGLSSWCHLKGFSPSCDIAHALLDQFEIRRK